MIGYRTLLIGYPHRLLSGYGPTEWDGRVLWADCRPHRHHQPSPERSCQCGVWAYRDDSGLRDPSHWPWPYAGALVWGGGRMLVSDVCWRAERAMILALSPPPWSPIATPNVREAAERLDIPMFDLDDLVAYASMFDPPNERIGHFPNSL